MVSEHMDNIGIAQRVCPKKADDSLPIGVARCIIHRIARLDAEVIVSLIESCNNLRYLCQIFGLNIAENKEFYITVPIIGFKYVLI